MEMRLVSALAAPSKYNSDDSRMGACVANSPIHDIAWMADLVIHGETRRYYGIVR